VDSRLKRGARSALGELAFRLGRDSVACDGTAIPVRRLRFGGEHFARDEDFLQSGTREADRLVRELGLSRDSRLLEIGCGPGRLVIGILRRVGDLAMYRGLDVDAAAIRWCKRHIESAHPNFRFELLDLANPRYNPTGTQMDDGFRLELDDCSFDFVYLYSVFSHLLAEDVRVYLREFRRVLVNDGRVFLTAFVEEEVADVSVNPQGYRREWTGPLHCVRYDRAFFERLVGEAGFRVERFVHGQETDGQSAIYLA
jgi:cyclopropane fatty-acyl-phospholipid synthase-like methyltransferase